MLASSDELFMKAAAASAFEGIRARDGGPFGAAIVSNGTLIATSHNTVLKDKDPTAHAEVNAIRQACLALSTHILKGCILYTTAEPCPMCLAAIYWARIDRIVVGVDRSCAAAFGFDDAFFYEEVLLPLEKRHVPAKCGVSCALCSSVFEEWKRLEGSVY